MGYIVVIFTLSYFEVFMVFTLKTRTDVLIVTGFVGSF